ncbi:MAG: GNAT family N-acetyltransferase [Opitutales bacterium]|nr:GNAT family N-acetyltransferase [Opitutales bacterium]
MYTFFREANLNDLKQIIELESQCFAPHRQSTRRSLRLSIASEQQRVIVQEVMTQEGASIVGCAILWVHKKALRLYSIAVSPEHQGKGIGAELMEQVILYASGNDFLRITLEADATNKKLIQWYERFGFHCSDLLQDYYADGEHAWRMGKPMQTESKTKPCENIIVLDSKATAQLSIENAEVVSAREYLGLERFQNNSNYRVFNLCSSYKHQKLGYYVSLLASARDHKIIPNVTTIRDFSSIRIIQGIAENITPQLQESLAEIKEKEYTLDILFGQSLEPSMQKLAKAIHNHFEALLFRAEFTRNKDQWEVKRLELLTLKKALEIYGHADIEALADSFFRQRRLKRQRLKTYHYDLAILSNPKEKTPPSCPDALQNFMNAAEDCGFFVEQITKKDAHRISEFDALFIRETTSVHHHTYTIARSAYAEGLIVIDDPWSILRCSNKIYLYERLRRARIQQPNSTIFQKGKLQKDAIAALQYPQVLKVPDGSFSLGVFKVNSEAELLDALSNLFKQSEVIIGQEFIPSPYDWRIGVIDRTPIFACKYYMARGHWQIYNWNEQNNDAFSGGYETVSIDQVPNAVLQTAVKASSLIGDSLYGVDLKEINGKAYVIEVNDNPNIDAEVEDAVLGKELYRKIITSFYQRIERERYVPRYVSYRKS